MKASHDSSRGSSAVAITESASRDSIKAAMAAAFSRWAARPGDQRSAAKDFVGSRRRLGQPARPDVASSARGVDAIAGERRKDHRRAKHWLRAR